MAGLHVLGKFSFLGKNFLILERGFFLGNFFTFSGQFLNNSGA